MTVVLVGADGAGKTTIGRRLPALLSTPARYIYLGANPAAATHALPTTRLVHHRRAARGRAGAGGPPPLDRSPTATGGSPPDRVRRSARSAARLAHQLTESAYQRAVIGWHRARGRIVVADRWYAADHHAHELAAGPPLPWGRALRAAALRRMFPLPDLVLVLDAPPEVLHARKGEGTVAELARRRDEYLAYLETVTHGQRIDATRPLPEVTGAVVAAIERAVRDARRGREG